jgi:hypothetical protein
MSARSLLQLQPHRGGSTSGSNAGMPGRKPVFRGRPEYAEAESDFYQESSSFLRSQPFRAVGNPNASFVPPIVSKILRSPSQALDATTRSFFETRFAHDFSQVRVHTSREATESARAMDALAFSVGPHIVFNAGCFNPATATGRKLLAHELTHIIQQTRGGVQPAESPCAEREARANAEAIERSSAPIQTSQKAALGIARQEKNAPAPSAEVASKPTVTRTRSGAAIEAAEKNSQPLRGKP